MQGSTPARRIRNFNYFNFDAIKKCTDTKASPMCTTYTHPLAYLQTHL